MLLKHLWILQEDLLTVTTGHLWRLCGSWSHPPTVDTEKLRENIIPLLPSPGEVGREISGS